MRLWSASGILVLGSTVAACASPHAMRPEADPMKARLRELGIEGRTYVNDLGAVASIHLGKVHVLGDDLLIEDIHGHLTYLDGATLNPRWDYYGLPRPFTEAPDFTPGSIIGLSGGKLHVLSRAAGIDEIPPLAVPVIPSAAPVATDTTLYVPTYATPAGNKTVYSVNLADGYLGWGWRTEGDVVADLAKGGEEGGDTFYFATQDGTLYAFPTHSASERSPEPAWVRNVLAPVFRDIEVEGGDLAVVPDDARLVLLDRITGDIRWEAYPGAGERAETGPQFSRNHVFYRVAGELRAFDRATGLRAFAVPGATRFVAERGNRVLLRGDRDTLLAVDKQSGKVLSRVRAPGWHFPTRVEPDSTVYAISNSGLVVAVEHGW